MRKGLPAVLFCPNRGFYLGVAQLAERLLWEQEAVGSSPTTQTMWVHTPLFVTSLHHIADEICKHNLDLSSEKSEIFRFGVGCGSGGSSLKTSQRGRSLWAKALRYRRSMG